MASLSAEPWISWDGPGSKPLSIKVIEAKRLRSIKLHYLRRTSLKSNNIYIKPVLYEDHKVKELKTFLRNRGIKIGTMTMKEQFIERLRKADRAYRFRFLDLPGELRNKIYRMAHHEGDHRRGVRGARALCRVSRQVRSETFLLYVSMGCFRLRIRSSRDKATGVCHSALSEQDANWLNQLSKTVAASVTRIEFAVAGDKTSGKYASRARTAKLRFEHDFDAENAKRISGCTLEVTRYNESYRE
ncbi:hypothetical protein H2203_008349 [Taxawa tesnikishii (nom. ined.)]|nr:hypothetical protein H2203_008349 [Dothideales sp. JES 119]